MLPLFKIFSLVIRVFTRPMINYTKRYHLSNNKNNPELLRTFFIRMGNHYNRLESIINRKFLKIETPDVLFVKPLSDDVALEKGVEFFYEIVIYIILLSLPLYELYTGHYSNAKKTEDQEARLNKIEEGIDFIKKEQEVLSLRLSSSVDGLNIMIKSQEESTAKLLQQLQVVRSDLTKYTNQIILQKNVTDLFLDPAGVSTPQPTALEQEKSLLDPPTL